MTTRLDGVAVVFVNHYSESLVVPKIPALQAAGAQVVVVDNSGTYEGIAGEQVLRPGSNVGFARACNLALEGLGSGAHTVCFHNPDLRTTPEAIDRLRRVLVRQPRPGLVTPAMRVGRVVRRNGYHYPSPARELLVGVRAIVAMGGREAGEQPVGDVTPTADRDKFGRGRRFGSGGLLVASRRAMDAVGGFDEDYFLYAEDLDLWHRVSENGFTTEIDTGTVVDHDEGTGGRMAAADRELLRWLGVELFAERTTPGSWSAFRQAHRTMLPMLARRGGTLTAPVKQAWDQGARPSEVQAIVRSLFAVSVA